VLLYQYLEEDGGKGGPHRSSGLICGNTMMKRKKNSMGWMEGSGMESFYCRGKRKT
jgi:hypothetical protein